MECSCTWGAVFGFHVRELGPLIPPPRNSVCEVGLCLLECAQGLFFIAGLNFPRESIRNRHGWIFAGHVNKMQRGDSGRYGRPIVLAFP